MSFAPPQIDGHTDALVAVVFDRLDRAATNRHGLSEAFGDIDFAVAGALGPRMPENVLGERLQNGQGMGETLVAAGSWHRSGHGNTVGRRKPLS